MLGGKGRPTPGPTYMSEEQKGQQSHMSFSSLERSPTRQPQLSESTSIEETSSHNDRTAQYLGDLRKSTLSRPMGSRPAPPPNFSRLRRTETEANLPAPSQSERPGLPTSNSMPIMPAQRLAHQGSDSAASARSQFNGRPLARPPSATPIEESSSPTERPAMQRTPSITYLERGTRWMEKQEARSLRMALEDMDLEGEKKVHSAAQDEAAELVWKHQNPEAPSANPNAPYPNPDTRRDYRSHLRKGSYQRSHSQDAVPVVGRRNVSGGSHGSGQGSVDLSITSKRRSMDMLRKVSPPSATVTVSKKRTPSGKSFGGLAEAVASDISKAHRRVSSDSKRILSGEKKAFMHPNDKIWEDPTEDITPAKQQVTQARPAPVPVQPTHIRKNPFARVRMQAEKLERSRSEPIVSTAAHHSVEIQRNPPSQLRKPWYMSNEPLPPTLPSSTGGQAADEVSPKTSPAKDGKEVRSDDIRAATSKPRSDYSPKLPRPTMVSDKPGRPIVSFKQDWKPKEVVLEEMHTPSLACTGVQHTKADDAISQSMIPRICVDNGTKPAIPKINVPDDPTIPIIVVPEDPNFAEPDVHSTSVAPSINVELPAEINVQPPAINASGSGEPSTRPNKSSQRPGSARPLPYHAATSPIPKSTPHYTPSVRQSSALCAHCALPIAGRVLSAAGERFHPSCFICHECHTNLELVAFYPEPERQRSERLDRIASRQSGLAFSISEGTTGDSFHHLEVEDGDETLRFFCHLDFHELFSPRCKSCKTPIEGEVIVACSAEWHVGHFFCAQCGDPFDSSTPFVEKDGYAWCVGCHTNRCSSKCRKCRKPVTETVVKALGWDWHGECFVCTECNGEFDEGRYFLRGDSQDPVCVKCEERRLKA